MDLRAWDIGGLGGGEDEEKGWDGMGDEFRVGQGMGRKSCGGVEV